MKEWLNNFWVDQKPNAKSEHHTGSAKRTPPGKVAARCRATPAVSYLAFAHPMNATYDCTNPDRAYAQWFVIQERCDNSDE